MPRQIAVVEALAVAAVLAMMAAGSAAELQLQLRHQVETSKGSRRFHTQHRAETWQPGETAIIVCDVWDLHHCLNAVRRAEEFAPRLNAVLTTAREAGVTIIHAPSDCMPAYAEHPARQRAIVLPKAANLPPDIGAWCSRIPAEEQAVYPIDQSDGGEDDDPQEHAAWAEKLAGLGRNPKAPWKKQADSITIDTQRDFISDRGEEVWSILEARGIRNVILVGVHTNMCVLGRPFGLRQMAKNGRNVVLLRDMTDTMYNPQRWPFVSHFTGTDLIVAHIERYVCPTITSDQILGDGKAFRFANDTRPHVVFVIAEDEYRTEQTLPEFAARQLGRDFRVSYVYGNERERNDIPGLEVLDQADAALISVRRRLLPAEQMSAVRRFVAARKPVIGIRTASHAFSARGEMPNGVVAWPEFDAQVFGGNYQGHYGASAETNIGIAPKAQSHPLLTGISTEEFLSGGSLYQTSPLADDAEVLMLGRIEGKPAEPAAWTFQRADGGRSFYTSLGHKSDFENPAFVRLLLNSIYWATDRPIPQEVKLSLSTRDDRDYWTAVNLPRPIAGNDAADKSPSVGSRQRVAWYRCVVRPPESWSRNQLVLHVPDGDDFVRAWCNGQPLTGGSTATKNHREFVVAGEHVWFGDANLLVLRIDGTKRSVHWSAAPWLTSGDEQLRLAGRWQMRVGDDPAWSNLPLPAKFGTSTDIVFQP